MLYPAEVKNQFDHDDNERKTWLFLLLALLISLPMIGFYYLKNFDGEKYAILNHAYSRNNEIKEVELPDGSRVILDAGSSIRYPQNFHSGDRDVFVEGSASLEVKPGKKLNIHSANSLIQLSQGRVDVTAYPETDYLIVSAFNNGIKLIPNEFLPQKFIEVHEGKRIIKTKASPKLFSSSINSDTQFSVLMDMNCNKVPLQVVAAKYYRAFNQRLNFMPVGIGDYEISANFRGMSREEIVNMLCIMLTLKQENQDSLILLKGLAC